MCTAVTCSSGHHFFGRTLDLEYRYNESVTVMPRRFPLQFRHVPAIHEHYAMIGIATVADGYPLYYDAVNEKGLCIAGLNFPGNACYFSPSGRQYEIASFELIPWLLANCSDVAHARSLLEQVRVTDDRFSERYPNSPLHWMIADCRQCIVVEPLSDGLAIHDNPVGVLTNNPPFPMQLFALSNFMSVSALPPENRFCDRLDFDIYSRGMGGLGLPGDLSSQSRFVRAAFTLCNSRGGDSDESGMNQIFHILDAVSVAKGTVRLGSEDVRTVYTSCCSSERGIYWYTTYENRCIHGVDMYREDLGGHRLAVYPLEYGGNVVMVN